MGREEVKTNWQSYWMKHRDTLQLQSNTSPIFEELKKIISTLENKYFLECGSGIGEISIDIAADGGKVYMIDISLEALKICKDFFSRKGLNGNYICASIFNIPFPEKSFDVVWNAGVLEHFKYQDQVQILKEMKRVCKDDGLIITFNPYAKAILYRISKFFAEKRKIWDFGEEYPVKTLISQCKSNELRIIDEYPFDFQHQITFLKYISKLIFYGFKGFYIMTPKSLKFLWLKFFGGYLLATVMKKATK